MNRREAAELLPIIKAFSEGKVIQYQSNGKWSDYTSTDLAFDIVPIDKNYRIKPEVKYRPFANAEECWAEMLKHQPFGWIKGKEGWHHSLITSIVADEEEVYINGISGFVLDEIMEHYTFSDGTTFGIKVEE